MGRLVNPDEFISNNVDKYIERSTSNYTTLLESTPVFVTYFHQNRAYTTNDLGLENVEDDLGRDSSIKYEKIRKLPVYGVDTLSLNLERGDYGLNSNVESELVFLPDTIKPYPNDYFSFDDLGDKYLFKVLDVQEDLIKSKPFYRVTYKFSKYENKDMESQIVDDFTVEYNNIGTDNTCIIKTSIYQLVNQVELITDKLIEFFAKNFYDKIHNVMTLNIHTLDVEIYSHYLNKFLIDNEVLELSRRQKDFYKTISLLEYIPIDRDFEPAYEKTLYHAVESQDVRQFFDRHFTYMDITYPHAPWKRSNKDYKIMIMVGTKNETLEKINPLMEFIDKEFYGRILINNPYVNDYDYFMENFIIKYINKNTDGLLNKEFLDRLNENIWRRDMRAYVYIPIIIYILRRLVRKELIKQN